MVKLGLNPDGVGKGKENTKDFNYEGEAHFKVEGGLIDPVKPLWGRMGEWVLYPNSKITNVQFLTPAKVTFTADGEKRSRMVYVDIANKQAFDEEGNLFFSDLIFAHLDEKNTLPEEFYIADDEISKKAAEAQEGFAQPE